MSLSVFQMEIFGALELGDFEKVRELMQDTGPSVRRRDTHCTLLHQAANHRQVDMVLFFLKFISPNVVNKEGCTPAHLAARKGHTQILRLLLADPAMDPDKRDNSSNTYKHGLTLPLMEAVVEDSRARVQELLRLGADPDHAAESPSEESAARDIQTTTARQLSHALHRDNILPLFKRNCVVDASGRTEDDAVGVGLQKLLPSQENKDMHKKIQPSPLEVCGPDVYRMDSAPRGYVCLLSYGSFQDRPDLHLEGSQTDAHHLASVFSRMGYSGHAHFSLTADQTRHQLAKVRDMEVLAQAGCAVFVISSHGEPRRHFLTSDMHTLDVQWVMDFFKDSQCPHLRNKPKLFIWDLCRGHQEGESGRGKTSGQLCGRVDEPLRDVVCLDSSSGGFTWHAFSEEGTPFIGALCTTLARHSPTKELAELYREFLKEYATAAPDAVPQLTNYGLNKRFYF
ncbi:Caspase-10 [Chionoecetes opilio]|uniref:Caspase-10 n=1 Tax=Chionoecetes opilio TaxID=41210 RepID=A0A8J5CNG4_CHIOP|nr:Caspase-10 [Chionoecetes opilio]